jgi:hypothetical protein
VRIQQTECAGRFPHALIKRSKGEKAKATHVSDEAGIPDPFADFQQLEADSWLIKDDIKHLVNPEAMKERLYMHDGFYTSHGDTFKDVCSGIGLDKAQWKMYYDWVHEDFMRGEIFLQRDENDQFVYPDGIGFDI